MAGAVTKTRKTEVADTTKLQDMFAADAGAGNENMGADDLAIPFLKIVSKLDPILDERDDVRAGDLLNTVSGKVFKQKDGVTVVPVAYQRRFIEWAPRGSGGSGAPLRILTPSDALPKTERDPDTNKDMVIGGGGTYLEDTHQQYVVIVNDDGTFSNALIAMKATQLKVSRKWNSMIAERVMKLEDGRVIQPPRFSSTYKMGSEAQSNSKGSWHGWTVEVDDFITDSSLYQHCKEFSESIRAGDVNVKYSEEENMADEKNGDVPF